MPKNPRVPIGVTSMCFWSMRLSDAIPMASDMGYDAMEVWVEHLWKFEERASDVAKSLTQSKLRRTVHCPIIDTNMASPNRGIREESLRQILQSVELTHDLGAELMVVHPGRLHSLKDPLDAYWDILIRGFERIVGYAEKNNVVVAVENMDVQKEMEVIKWSEDIRRISDHFGVGKLGVVLDTTHLSNVGQIVHYIQATNQIIHTHLSDAKVNPIGFIDTHLPLGQGEINFPQVFEALLPNFHGIVSLETFIPPGNPQSILAQREWLDGMLNSSVATTRE